MWKISAATLLVLIMTAPVFAQENPSPEVAVGYSMERYGGNIHGISTLFTGNANSWLGITGEVGAGFSNQSVFDASSGITGSAKLRTLTLRGGPRISHRTERVTTFAQFLYGGTRFKVDASAPSVTTISVSSSSFAPSLTAGGGVDVLVSPRTAIRAQIDYLYHGNLTLFDENLGSSSGFRIFTGVVFRFR